MAKYDPGIEFEEQLVYERQRIEELIPEDKATKKD